MKAKLILLHSGPEKQINIFIHGYGAVGTVGEFNGLAEAILSARPAGRVYLLFWTSGFWKSPGLMHHVVWPAHGLAMAGLKIGEFKYFERKAEQLGKRFFAHLSEISHARDYPINLIGYSLGARVIHYALAENDWSNYRVRDVILLGGAADSEDEDWTDCADKVQGKIYNAYSRSDWVLRVKPDARRSVGRHGILWSYVKIVNRKYKLGHLQYWENLEYLLTRLWPSFLQAKEPLVGDVECPYCGAEFWLFPPWDDSPIECTDCGLDYKYEGKKIYIIENDIECSECPVVSSFLPRSGYVYSCSGEACGAHIWEYGDHVF